ncbi:MAG: Cyanophycin synthetase [Candidatus Moranbacteria bacterium GW2011_GWE2_47_10]|nr:MAG: Cyanophycin synthetase [Candidatus Moranbacteria bacterium GW2011_GWE2_47_10]
MYRELSKKEAQDIKHGGFRSFIGKALEIGVRVEVHGEFGKLLKLSHGEESLYCLEGSIPVSKRLGNYTRNKELTKIILGDAGISVPRGILAESLEEAEGKIEEHGLGFPLIVKPLDGTVARGVTWDINSKEELEKAVGFFKEAQTQYGYKNDFLVEQMALGDEYRVLIFDGKVVSCVKKVPASVEGDGIHTVAELIDSFNKGRLEGFGIRIDDVVRKTLDSKGLSLETVPEKGQVLKLRNNLNMSDGGRSIDCMEEMHPYFKDISERAAKLLGLTYGGLDLITADISDEHEKYVILEINPNPYYNMNEKPLVEGKGVDFSLILLKNIFPKLAL